MRTEAFRVVDECDEPLAEDLGSFADNKAGRTEGWGAHREDEWERLRIALARTGRIDPA